MAVESRIKAIFSTSATGACGTVSGEGPMAVGVAAGPGGGGPQPARKATERMHAARIAAPSFILDISKYSWRAIKPCSGPGFRLQRDSRRIVATM